MYHYIGENGITDVILIQNLRATWVLSVMPKEGSGSLSSKVTQLVRNGHCACPDNGQSGPNGP